MTTAARLVTRAALVASMLAPGLASAQPFGPGTYVEAHHVGSFRAVNGTSSAVDPDFLTTNMTGGECCLLESFDPPTGAVLVGYQFQACDDSDTGSINVSLRYCEEPGDACQYFANTSTGVVEVPGCVTLTQALNEPTDNRARTYVIQISDTDEDAATRALAVRLYWQRRVAPAPLASTYSDVPTGHPMFPFVEALTAAGLTVGCSAGPPALFCPEQPVTRGEAAVFLSVANGFHWPVP